MKKDLKTDTSLVHSGRDIEGRAHFVSPPLYRGSTVLYPDVKALQRTMVDHLKEHPPYYGRFGSPTTRALESAINEIEGGHGTVTVCSGLAAITTAILSLAKAGDHILVSDSVYAPTRQFCDSLTTFGIETEYFDPWVGAEIEKHIRLNTSIVFLESPGSLTFEMQDVPKVTEICRKRNIKTLIDNTWATPLFFQPLKHGVDVSIHAATKYITGHADSILGVIICNESTYEQVKTCSVRLGQFSSAEDVYSGLRGLKTLSVRLKQHQEQALELVEWLSKRDEVKKILYPAWPDFEGYKIWKRDFSGASGLFSIILHEHFKREAIERTVNSLKLFGLGHSWGGFESLLVPMEPQAFRGTGKTTGWAEKGQLLRLHVGFEDLGDLKADLNQAFSNLS